MSRPRACWAEAAMTTPEQKKGNLRLGLILASVALAFFFGFMAKMILLSH